MDLNTTFKRTIKSFARRNGRQTEAQKNALDQYWPLYGLKIEQGPLDLKTLFPAADKYALEIGFGMGSSFIAMAEREPDMGFIGIEVHEPGVGTVLAHTVEHNLQNIRVYSEDAVEVLKQCIPDNSLDRFQLFFPDPWPKKRHHKRRLVQAEFMQLLLKKLKSGAIIMMATDWANYAEHMIEILSAQPELENVFGAGQFAPDRGTRPETKFERRGIELGHEIFDLRFKKK